MTLRPRLPRDESGTSGQVVAFLVAGAIFLAAVATVLVVSQGAVRDTSELDEESKGVQAAGLADLLVGSTGIGWTSDADDLDRLGLLAENGSGLDPDSLDALRGAVNESTDNGKVDYKEALVSLGIETDGTAGFHIRVYPVGLDDLSINESLSVGYIADWTPLATAMATPTATVSLPVTTVEAMTVKANTELNRTMVEDTFYERQALRALGVDFTDRVYITLATPLIYVDFVGPVDPLLLGTTLLNIPLMEGDVYPEHRSYIQTVLTSARLSQYDVLIVGSGVDHGNLIGIKDRLPDWVEDGGTLIVLGSQDQSTAWLNPLLNVGVDTVNGAPTAPDIAHPLLKEPNELAWTSYDTYDQGWDIQDSGAVAAYEDFSHVIIQDGEDILAVSKQSAFDEGRVILTSYRARDIAGSISAAEAQKFLENMVSYADREALYLDYGGTVPADQPVALAVRQSWLWDEVYGQVPVRIEVLAWG